MRPTLMGVLAMAVCAATVAAGRQAPASSTGTPLTMGRLAALRARADPELQSQSIGHRLLMRMGEAHSARIKTKLVELRAALIAAPAGDQ